MKIWYDSKVTLQEGDEMVTTYSNGYPTKIEIRRKNGLVEPVNFRVEEQDD